MKHILYSAIALGLALGLGSCTENYEDYNHNPSGVSKQEMEQGGYSLIAAMNNLESWIIPTDVNTNQFTECLLGGSYGGYIADSNPGFNGKNFAQYSPENTWNRVLFKDVIPKAFIFSNEVKNVTEDPVPLAVTQVIKVAIMQRVTDAYGPVPYSKVGADGQITAPYDGVETIYNTMLDELEQAVNTMTEHRTSDFNAKADRIYGGSVDKWIKFANSLRLRMAMRVSNVSPGKAKEVAEAAVNHEMGVMTTNDDNAFLTPSSTNPFEVVMYEYNGGDSRISGDITSYMNGYNDPRRAAMFTPSTFEGHTSEYIGIRSGITIPDGNTAHQYSNYNVTTSGKLLIMNAAEVAFLRAEGALRGWNMGGTAKSFYEQGIRLSFDQWGVSGADTYLADNILTPAKYTDPIGINNYTGRTSVITIAWDDAAAFEANLERIITQKWIANFPLGQEAWAEIRRTGYPKLMPVVVNNSGGTVSTDRGVRRLAYPQEERLNNQENYLQAVSGLLGGADNMGTDLWWAKKQ